MVYYLSLGANLGNREQTINHALELIEQQAGHVLRCSAFYYSAPWGFESENEFCNLCCSVQSALNPLSMLDITAYIERLLGRSVKSTNREYHDRLIDIDLIRAFDDERNEIYCNIPYPHAPGASFTGTLLTLPHPLWQERDFVKLPLAEIMQ